MKEETIVDSELVVALKHAFGDVVHALEAMRAAILADQDEYEVFVHSVSANGEKCRGAWARSEAAKSMSVLYKDESSDVDAGLLCASPATVEAVHAVNEAKRALKKAVMAIRESSESDAKMATPYITKLLKTSIDEHGFRSAELSKAMSTAGMGELDLKKCYTEIRVMPQALDVFCWTWATKHSRDRKIPLEKAKDMVKEMFEGKEKESALEINLRYLSECRDGEELVQRKKLPNQLRANYAFMEDGEMKRTSCPISGVVIVQGKTLPRYVWRDDPVTFEGARSPQVKRVSSIEPEPLIAQLNLYRYVR